MNDGVITILLVEDNPGDVRFVREMLEGSVRVQVRLKYADRLSAVTAHLAEGDVAVVLLDLSLPDAQGLDAFTRVHALAAGTPIVILTGMADEEMAIKAVQEGAQDYLVKGEMGGGLLLRSIRYAIERKRLEDERDRIFTLSPDIVAVLDIEGRVRQVNPAIKGLLGFETTEVVGKQFAGYMHVDDREQAVERFRFSGDRPAASPVENRVYCKDGSYKWVAWAATVDTARGLVYAIGRDITQRKELERRVQDRTEELVRANLKLTAEIGQRRQVEWELRESEERYRQLVEFSPDTVFVHSEEKLVYCNPAAVALLGASSPEQLIGRPIAEIVHPDYRVLDAERVREMAEQGTNAQLLGVKLFRVDGSIVDVEVCSAPLMYGGLASFISIGRDITERKEAEQAFRATEARFRAIFDRSALGITLVDSRGRIVDANPEMERMLGYSREELVGQEFTWFTHPEHWGLQCEMHEVLMRRQREKVQMDKRYRRKDGTEMLGRWTSTVIEREDGSLMRLSFVEDISERERAIKELTRLRQEWDDVFDTITDSVMILDREQRIISANRATTRLLGKNEQEVVGKHCFEICHGATEPPGDCPALQVVASGERAARQMYVEKLGAYCLVSCSPMFDSAGQVERIIHTVRDNTVLHHATEELRRMRSEWWTVFESVDQPAMILDPAHGIMAVNSATVRAVGKLDQEILGKRCFEVFHDADEPLRDCPMEQALRTRHAEKAEVSIECLRGRFVVACTPVFSESGEVEKIIHIATDVTDRVRAEEELRDNQARLHAVFETLRVQKTGRFE